MTVEKRPFASGDKKFFALLRVDAYIRRFKGIEIEAGNQEKFPEEKLAGLKAVRRRLNRDLRKASPVVAFAKSHTEHLKSAEESIASTDQLDIKVSRKKYIALTSMEIRNKRLKKGILKVEQLTKHFDSTANTKNDSGGVDENSKKEIGASKKVECEKIKLTALETETFRMLMEAGENIVPTKELTELVREWRKGSLNAKYNLISSLKLKLKGSSIKIENVYKKGYILNDPEGKIGKFLESTEIIPDPLLIKRMEVEKIQQETANTEATCMILHLQGKTVEAIAGELKLPVNRVKALIVSAELKSKLGL